MGAEPLGEDPSRGLVSWGAEPPRRGNPPASVTSLPVGYYGHPPKPPTMYESLKGPFPDFVT